MEYSYRTTARKDDNGTTLVSFPDFPGVHTFGEDRKDAYAHALDALITGVEFYVRTKRAIPAPTPGAGRRVTLPTTLAAKVALHNLMLDRKVNRAELGRRLGVHRPQVDRLIDLRHGSRLEQLEAAYDALGHRLVLHVAPAATKR